MEKSVITIEQFEKLYDLNQSYISEVEYKNNNLRIKTISTIKQEFIANGYRENFEYDVIDTFIFKGLEIKDKITSINKIEVQNGLLVVNNGKEYITKVKEIEHIKEYEE